MEIGDINRWGAELEQQMKLETHPIAIKWYEKVEDVPQNALFPKRMMKKHMALCQAFAYVRMKGMTIAMTKEDHWCWNPLVGFGQVDCSPGTEAFNEVVDLLGISDHDKAVEFFTNFPRLPLGRYNALVLAPLAAASFEPDVVLIYSNTAQCNHMIRAIKGATGDYVRSVFDGIDSCIYCTVPSFAENEYRVTLPDPGDRERAHAGDDEIILTIPGKRLEEFMTSFSAMNRFMGFSKALIDFNLDFARPPFYNKLFDLWGLEKGEDW